MPIEPMTERTIAEISFCLTGDVNADSYGAILTVPTSYASLAALIGQTVDDVFTIADVRVSRVMGTVSNPPATDLPPGDIPANHPIRLLISV